MDTDKRGIVIMGATSGMGREVARLFALRGWRVGAAGRRVELLESLRDECPDGSVVISQIDVTAPEDSARLEALAQKESATVYLHCSGVGYRIEELDVVYGGDELACVGIRVPVMQDDYRAVTYHINRV